MHKCIDSRIAPHIATGILNHTRIAVLLFSLAAVMVVAIINYLFLNYTTELRKEMYTNRTTFTMRSDKYTANTPRHSIHTTTYVHRISMCIHCSLR